MTTATVDARERFVHRFDAAWATSDPQQLMAILHRDVRLLQPILPSCDGKPAAAATMTRFIATAPGVHADLRAWVPTPTGVLIEFDLVAPGSPELRWGVVDRFDLAGDEATFRISYWDLHQLAAGVLRRPDVLLGSRRAGGRLRAAAVLGAAGARLPAPVGGRRGSHEITEFVRTNRRGEPTLRACVGRPLAGAQPSRVYVAAPLRAAHVGARPPAFTPTPTTDKEHA
jgi:hypothetical protein